MQQAKKTTPTRQEELLKLFTAAMKQDRVNTVSETNPWGTLIASEFKRNETRTWPARLAYGGPIYCGPLAIHIAKRMDEGVCYTEPFSQALEAAGYHPDPRHKQGNSWGLPLGSIVALVWLDTVWQVNEYTTHRIPGPTSYEYAFGNYQPGRFVWTFSCAYRLSTPIPIMRGAPGIWKWTPPSQFWNEIQAQADQTRLQINTRKKDVSVVAKHI